MWDAPPLEIHGYSTALSGSYTTDPLDLWQNGVQVENFFVRHLVVHVFIIISIYDLSLTVILVVVVSIVPDKKRGQGVPVIQLVIFYIS